MPVSASNQSTAESSAPQTDAAQERGALRSRLLAGDSYLHKVALGQRTIEYEPESNMRHDGFKNIQIALKIVLPELINDPPDGIKDRLDELLTQRLRDGQVAGQDNNDCLPERIKNFKTLKDYLICRLRNWQVSDRYDDDTDGWLYTFQELIGLREKGSGEKVTLNAATLRGIDAELEKIQYYSTDPAKAKTLHNASKAIQAGYRTRVISDRAKVYTEPNTAVPAFDTLEMSDLVLVIHILPKDWCFINLADGTPAYVNTHTLANRIRVRRKLFDQLDNPDDQNIILSGPMPDPEAKLYKIKPGEKLEHIVNREYDVTADRDRRFYANVLLYVNNPDSKKMMWVYDLDNVKGTRDHDRVEAAIYLEDSDAKWNVDDVEEYIAKLSRKAALTAKKWSDVETGLNKEFGGWSYEQIKYKANYTIWLPSKKFVKTLKDVVAGGSIIRGQVADVKRAAIDFRNNQINPLINEVGDSVGQRIEDLWPDKMGIRLEAAVGATFGVPIDIDIDADFYLRRDGNTLKLTRTGVLGLRPNLEFGIGSYFTASKGRTQAKKGKPVFGVEIGAGIYVGLKLLISQELTFPLKDETAMASFFTLVILEPLILTGGPSALVATVLRHALTFFDIDPNDYTTKFKFQVTIEGGASGQISAGLRFAKRDDSPLGWTEDIDAYNSGSGWREKMIANCLSAELAAAVANEIALGYEYEVPDGKFIVHPKTEIRIPAQTEHTLVLGQSLTASASVPLVNALLPDNFAGGLKLKMGYRYDVDIQKVVENPETYHIGFLVGIGDLDAYVEPGYEVTVWYDPLTLNLDPPDLSQLLEADAAALIDEVAKILKMFHSVEVKLRTGLSGIAGSKLAAIKNKDLQTMLKSHGERHWGLIYKMFLDLDLKIVRSDLSDFADSFMGEMIKEVGENALEPSKALVKVLETMTVGRPPSQKNATFMNQFYNALKEQKLTLHAEAGGGAGGSIKASAGAKGRGRVYLGARATWHSAVTFDQVKKLLNLSRRTDIKKKLLASPPQSINYITLR